MENRFSPYHHLFKTQCLDDGSAYFGITSNDNPYYGQNGNFPYAGNGPKLLEKVAKHGSHKFKVTVVFTSADYNDIKKRLDKILADVTGHPLSLNVSDEETSQKMSESHTGVPKPPEVRAAMSEGHIDNLNALGHVKTEEIKTQISETKKKQRLKWIHNTKTNEELQIEAGEDLLDGFQFGRLSKKRRKRGPYKSRINIAKLTDDQRVRLPDFMLNAIEKQQKENPQ